MLFLVVSINMLGSKLKAISFKVRCDKCHSFYSLIFVGGSLICCDECPTSFHADCLQLRPEEYEGRYICDDCQSGRYLLYGDIAWVKLGHYRYVDKNEHIIRFETRTIIVSILHFIDGGQPESYIPMKYLKIFSNYRTDVANLLFSFTVRTITIGSIVVEHSYIKKG